MPAHPAHLIGRLLPLSFLALACSQTFDDGPGTDISAATAAAGSMSSAAMSSSQASGAAAQQPASNAAAGSSGALRAVAGASANVAVTLGAAGMSGAVAPAAGSGVPAAGSGGLASAGNAAPAVGAAGAAATGALPPPPVPAPLQFRRCGSFECAELKVPLDYADPSGEQISLAVQRRATTGAQRIGSLLINPGGPGGSAIEFLTSFVQIAGNRLLQRFDIVAFDPRGVGQSTPLNCHSTIEKLTGVDPTPNDEAGWTAADDVAKTFADECAQKHAKLLPHLGTPDVARDMDQVRAAIGDAKLTYLGFSYGTSLGAHYAQLFPEHVRALVLDGALDMSLSALEISLEQAVGFDKALQTFFGWCGKAAGNCAWANGSAPAQAFKQLSAKVDMQALMASRPVGPGEFLIGVIAPLYGGEDGYRSLSSALTSAARGDGSGLLSFTNSYLDRKPDGSYGNMQEANSAVNCLDEPAPDYAGIRAEAPRFQMASETFGLATLSGLLVCAHWPVKGQPPPASVAWGVGAPPILVVGTTGDPATPYAWAEALSKELESGVLLTYEGEGHTAYLRSVPCIDDAVEVYLIDGKVPQDGKRCAGNNAPSRLTLPAMLGARGPLGPRPAPQQLLPSPVSDH